jgi:hypothetical protein
MMGHMEQSATLPIPDVIPPFPVRRRRGRPSSYNVETADEICIQIAEGKSLKAICREEWSPDFVTVWRWLKSHEDFRNRYVEAREISLEGMADDLMEIADDGRNDWILSTDPENPGYRFNGEHYARSRLRVDTRKFVLSKLSKAYSDKWQGATIVIPGGVDGLPTPKSPDEVARRVAFLLSQGITPEEIA